LRNEGEEAKAETYLCFWVSRSDLLINSKFFLFGLGLKWTLLASSSPVASAIFSAVPSMSSVLSSRTYFSRSSERKERGLRASTICTTRSERSRVRQSWRQTSRLRSNGVRRRDRLSWRLQRGEDGQLVLIDCCSSIQHSLGESTAPLKEAIPLFALELESGGLPRPSGTTGDLKTSSVVGLPLLHLPLLLRREKVGVVSSLPDRGVGDDLDVLAFCDEGTVSGIGKGIRGSTYQQRNRCRREQQSRGTRRDHSPGSPSEVRRRFRWCAEVGAGCQLDSLVARINLYTPELGLQGSWPVCSCD